jgi:sterol desaturase/sphingolipid hydroxylase (fatty acid hydroxylase superfamily)
VTRLDVLAGAALALVVAALLVLETAAPLRRRVRPRGERLAVNAALGIVSALLVRLALVPVGVLAAGAGTGLLPRLAAPPLVAWPLGLLLLDYTMYLWHRLNHRVPLLWRFHVVHHTDLDLDVATAFRFHAGELLLSCGWRAVQVLAIGPPVAVVLAFEVVFAGATAFHHSNWRLPAALDRALCAIVVTPRMHGIHHSMDERETNSNWSGIVSWWDRVHRTLCLDRPQAALVIGLPAYRAPLGVRALLALPFRRQPPAWPRPT